LSADLNEAVTLTATQRLYGFGITLALSVVFIAMVPAPPERHFVGPVGR